MKKALLALATSIWFAVGIMLTLRGVRMLLSIQSEGNQWKIALALAIGAFVGIFKGRYVLSKSALRNRLRIIKLPTPIRFWQVFAPRFYGLIFLMMVFGRLLRLWASYGGFPAYFVGGLYCGIGGALFISAFAYIFPKQFDRADPWKTRSHPVVPGQIGVILANLGTPTAPTGSAVGRFLREFLSDRRVIEVNPIIWWVILNAFIIPWRKYASAALYRRIFTEEGSPLLFIGLKQARAVQQKLGPKIPVRLAMRYGSPNFADVYQDLEKEGCERILVLPLYPQYSGTTNASIYDAAYDAARRYRQVPCLRFVPPFPEHPAYIAALAERFKESAANFDYDHVILSYHSIPIRYARLGDPYASHCVLTTRALVRQLNLERGQWTHCYQSIFGSDPWLGPATDKSLIQLAKAGKKRVLVICPGFLVDCLETIDEIGDLGRDSFKAHGGDELILVPCLNDHPLWIDALTTLIEGELQGWQQPSSRPLEVSTAHG